MRTLIGALPVVRLGVGIIHVSFVFIWTPMLQFVALIFKKETKTTIRMFLFVRLR